MEPTTAPSVAGQDFASALRAAVSARGLSLGAVRSRLAEHHVSVSVATLSYWQSGRSRPERATSIAAIGPLEQVLDLPRGFLAGRLDYRAGSPGPSSDYRVGHLTQVLPDDWAVVDEAIGQLGLSPDDGLSRVSVHDRVTLGRAGQELHHDVRTLFLALRDGADRFATWYDTDEPGTYAMITPRRNCHVGRTLEFPQVQGVAAELVLDRPMRTGECLLVEYRLEALGSHAPQDRVLRGLGGPTRELLIEVHFDTARLPTRIEQVAIVDGAESVRPRRVAPHVRVLLLDRPGGTYGLRWRW